MHDERIFSVTALTATIRGKLEGAFPFVWVRGQVVNLSRPSSGHVYFSLRDENASLAAVWFKSRQQAGERFDPLTGEIYEDGPRESLAATLENGREIVCAGRIAVYDARGIYQLVVEIAREAGLGRLHEEFGRLCSRLEALGYFAVDRKRPLPPHPVRVAVITAPGGAAIRDFLRIAENRGLGARIRIFPVPVQGESAPPAIIAALRRVWDEAWAEAVVLIRGGGSMEDLWAFNNAELAGAIFQSPVPVLAGIGHEVNYTLADMTADARAATPSHAAQMLWPAREELFRRWRALDSSLEQAGARCFKRMDSRLEALERGLGFCSPLRRLEAWGMGLASQTRLLDSAGRLFLERHEARLRSLAATLGVAPARLPALDGRFVELARRLGVAAPQTLARAGKALENLAAALSRAPERLPAREQCRASLAHRLNSAGLRALEQKNHRLEREMLRLEALSPHAPLERGYALARKEDGAFVRRIGDVSPGELLRLVVSDGDIPVRVTGEKQ
jgi:exodeoxyribonuclease VII large subunit